MSNNIKITGTAFEVMDAIEYITLADSFVKNKIGSGNGEAKLYVGNVADEHLVSFFENFEQPINCFFVKKDFARFLEDAEDEYKNPQQDYKKKDELPIRFEELKGKLDSYDKDILDFEIYRVGVEPPRVYVKSSSNYYTFMREIGLPNISYLSILKLKRREEIVYYFRIFIDYKSDVVLYKPMEEAKQEAEIANSNVSSEKKQALNQARVGQGEYRMKLLDECPYCPFTLVNDERLLTASHIKPWVKSDEKEKIDPKNGFMFTPTYDRLFDRGFITFEDDKRLVVSPWISPMNQKRLQIYNGKLIDRLPLDDERKEYLRYHREFIFKA